MLSGLDCRLWGQVVVGTAERENSISGWSHFLREIVQRGEAGVKEGAGESRENKIGILKRKLVAVEELMG